MSTAKTEAAEAEDDPNWIAVANRAVDESRREHDDWGLAWSAAFAAVAGTVADDAAATRRFAQVALSRGTALDYTNAVLRACLGWADRDTDRGAGASIAQAIADLDRMGDAMFRPHLMRLVSEHSLR